MMGLLSDTMAVFLVLISIAFFLLTGKSRGASMSDFICRASSFVLLCGLAASTGVANAAKDEATVDQKKGNAPNNGPSKLSLTWWATAKRSPEIGFYVLHPRRMALLVHPICLRLCLGGGTMTRCL